MKLIQILALATAMATMATAQNSTPPQQAKTGPAGGPGSASGQQSGGAKPSPTATPAASKGNGSKPQAAAKTSPATGSPSAAKSGTGTAAKASSPKQAAANPKQAVANSGGAAASGSKTAKVKTSTAPAKGQTGTATASASTQANQTKGKATPTPVVAAKPATAPVAAKKTDAKPAETKKTEAKKTDAKPAIPPKTGAAKPAVIAVKPAQGAPTRKSGPAQAKTKVLPLVPAPKVTEAGSPAKAAEKPRPAVRVAGAHGRRDPFVSPIRAGRGDSPSPTCTTGKRCLSIPELILQGTVKDTTGKMMAVVANSTKRTYFLRENDQVFNGSVEKITSDSIIFREFVKDALGRETAREVVKKLVPTT
jgi:Tfp pilus assembly protein PilP